MTIEESIKILEQKKEYSERIIDNFLSHSRGEIKDANETIEMCDMAISALKEIQQYREIGTVEECREAVEKQKPKKPEFIHMLSDTKYAAKCECGRRFAADIDCRYNPKFCSKCGIEFDWSEEDERD